MYTGVVDNLVLKAYDLFVDTSENNFGISDLHIECKELLIKNLADHNFFRTIIACQGVYCHCTHEQDVFDECIIFLKKNLVTIMNTTTCWDWNKLLHKTRPLAIQHLLLSFCSCLDISKCRKKLNTENSAEYVSTDSCPKEFEALWNGKTNSDIEIHVGKFSQREYKYSAHKVVLSARSSYFRKMCEIYKNSNVISVPFIAPEIFNEVLRYMYTNRVENLDNHAEKILDVATFFSIDDLKFECEKVLENTISLKNDSTNIFHRVLTAYDYDAKRLKHKALEFIIEKIFFCPDSERVFERQFKGIPFRIPDVVMMVDVLKKMASDYELYYLY